MDAPVDWTPAMLAVYIIELEKMLNERFETQNKELEVARETQNAINYRSNEFRAALRDQSEQTERTMVPRREYDERHKVLEVEIDVLRDRMILSEGATKEELAKIHAEILEAPRRELALQQTGHLSRLATRAAVSIATIAVLTLIVTVVALVVHL